VQVDDRQAQVIGLNRPIGVQQEMADIAVAVVDIWVRYWGCEPSPSLDVVWTLLGGLVSILSIGLLIRCSPSSGWEKLFGDRLFR